VTYVGGVGRVPAPAGRLSVLVFLLLALLLSAVRVYATTAAMTNGPTTGTSSDPTQTLVFAVIWVVAYFAQAVAGWLLWRSRARPYGHGALIMFWILLGLQGLRLLNLLGSRLTAGQLPWSAFGTVVLLDVVGVIAALFAWQVSRRAGVLIWAVLAWMLVVTAITGTDALLQNGLPLT
jgi:benzodiazapine receptor